MYYDIGKDAAFCHVCLRTEFEKKFHASTKRDAAFITKDFTYWKDATSSFCNHQISGCHKEAIAVIEVLSHQSRDVGELLNAHQQNQKAENREMFLRILENVRFLARQGLALSHGDGLDSDVIQLLRLRASDCVGILQ